eukprot:jgi/Mesen1/4501/ME000023S03872
MKEIACVMNIPAQQLEEQGVTTEDLEGLLEELQQHVESIDMANGLSPEAPLDAEWGLLDFAFKKALAVLQYLMQANASDRQVASDLGLGPVIIELVNSADPDVRQAALHALLELLLHGATAAGLTDATSAAPAGAISQAGPSQQDKDAGGASGSLPTNQGRASGSSGASGFKEEQGRGSEDLREILSRRMEHIRGEKDPEEVAALRDERHLLDAVWKRCFAESSPLHRAGLIDEAEAPDYMAEMGRDGPDGAGSAREGPSPSTTGAQQQLAASLAGPTFVGDGIDPSRLVIGAHLGPLPGANVGGASSQREAKEGAAAGAGVAARRGVDQGTQKVPGGAGVEGAPSLSLGPGASSHPPPK